MSCAALRRTDVYLAAAVLAVPWFSIGLHLPAIAALVDPPGGAVGPAQPWDLAEVVWTQFASLLRPLGIVAAAAGLILKLPSFLSLAHLVLRWAFVVRERAAVRTARGPIAGEALARSVIVPSSF